jgi:DNA-binding YbaB/EbfC family protein
LIIAKKEIKFCIRARLSSCYKSLKIALPCRHARSEAHRNPEITMGGFNPKQLQEMLAQARQQAESLQEKMRETVVDGSAGGGSVTVKMNGQKQVLRVTIDPEMVKANDLEMLQDLITAAMNDAGRKVDEAMQSKLGGMLGGMGLGGMF